MTTSHITLLLVLTTMSLVCHAQGSPPVPINLSVERSRISQERAASEALFIQKQQRCYQRFAVSDCLGKAKGERRVVLGELRRQEIHLNSVERQAKAAAGLERIQRNTSPERPQELDKTPISTTVPNPKP